LLQEHHRDSFLDDDAKLIVIPEASHMIMLEQPTLVARAIVAYLQELR
jgi:pimeloyl-ACP methyl ester carboxylesterase